MGTMPNGLDNAIGRLKRATIDAYMAENDWLDGQGGSTEYRGDLAMGQPPGARVSTPDPWGEGGGEWFMDEATNIAQSSGLGGSGVPVDYSSMTKQQTPLFQAEFEKIRQCIDELIAPWRDLPVPGDISYLAEQSKSNALKYGLNTTTGENGDLLQVPGPLAVDIQGIHDSISGLTGGMVANFKQNFLRLIEHAITAQYILANFRSSALGALAEMWKAARKDVVKIVNRTADAMSDIQYGSNSARVDGEFIRIVGKLLEGAAIFIPAGFTVNAFKLGAIFSGELATYFKGHEDPKSGGSGTMKEILGVFKRDLGKLNSEVKKAETGVAKFLQRNVDGILEDRRKNQSIKSENDRNRSKVDLVLPDFDSRKGYVVHDPGLVQEIVVDYLPSLSESLGRLSADASRCAVIGQLSHNSEIGAFALGCASQLNDLNQQLVDLTKELSSEADQASIRLGEAASHLDNANDSAVQKLKELLAEFDKLHGNH